MRNSRMKILWERILQYLDDDDEEMMANNLALATAIIEAENQSGDSDSGYNSSGNSGFQDDNTFPGRRPNAKRLRRERGKQLSEDCIVQNPTEEFPTPATEIPKTPSMAAAAIDIVELHRNSPKWAAVVQDIVKLERKIFPKHESLVKSFDKELKKKNTGLLYIMDSAANSVSGYVMYSWPSSLFTCITKLAIKDNCRRNGYGEALLKAAIEKCRTRKVGRISLHVDPLRTPAVSLYKKLGFKVDSSIQGYYSSERDVDIMYLDFDGSL